MTATRDRPPPVQADASHLQRRDRRWSDATVVVEGNHYFPPSSVNWDLMTRSRAKRPCPWKGVASYYDLSAAGDVQRGAAWSYERPWPWVRRIRGHVAFDGAVGVHR